MTLSQSEIYAYHFQNEEPSCYTRMPDIIHHLTYVDPENQQIKRLSPHAIVLYMVIKQIAGDKGRCWKNTENLAEHCNMSMGMISNCKKELSQKFQQLDGNSLILIEQKQKSTFENENIKNKTTYHSVCIINIWKWNNAYMRSRAHESSKKEYADSPHEGGGGALSPHETATQEALSPHERNNTPLNKTSMSKEQHPPASPDSVCFSNAKRERLFPSDVKKKAYDWLIKQKCEEPLAFSIVNHSTIEDFTQASVYLEAQMKRPNFVLKKAKWAYFQDIIRKKYWIKE